MRAGLLLACLCMAAPGFAAEPPLRAGIVPDSPPFVTRTRTGRTTGFSVELFRTIAQRMKRDIVFSAAPLPALTASLASGELDVLTGPIQATPDRASEMLLTEGYILSEYQFGAPPRAPIDALTDLRGRRLAVVAGSDYAEWADRNAAKFGFTIQPCPSLAAVFDASQNGQADATLTGSAALRAAVASHRALVAGLALPETRTHLSAAFREADTELRDEVEDTLRCLKQDGTVAKLSKAWFGVEPGPEDLENLVIPGYGVPGLAGFDPRPRKQHCSA